MGFESTLPDRTTVNTAAEHIDDHLTMHGILKAKPWYNVMDYGSSNNTARLDAARDAARVDGGGTLVIPANQTFALGANPFYLDYALSAVDAKISLIGAGSQTVTLSWTGAGPAIFWGTSETLLSNPRQMSEMGGFSLDGPGKATASSVGMHIREASYFRMEDIYCQASETGFKFDGGDQFLTGGNIHTLRGFNLKKGIHLRGDSANECTDVRFYGCYMNSGYGATLQTGTIGYHIERGNTNQFFGCSEEAYEIGFQLGLDGAGGQASRNAFYYCRDEISGTAPQSRWHEAVVIFDGTDNAFFGMKGHARDYTSNQTNVIIGKRAANRSSSGDTQHKLVRNLDGRFTATGSTTNADATLTVTERTFNPYDVGRPLYVEAAGSAGGALKTTTVATFTDALNVEMASVASNTGTVTAQDVLVQATMPAAAHTMVGTLLSQDMLKADDKLVFYYVDQSGAPQGRDLIAGTDI